MPMTIKVGLAQKVGLPDFGSFGASCGIELELDGSLLFQDPAGLREKVYLAYQTCREAVQHKLANPPKATNFATTDTPAAMQEKHRRLQADDPQQAAGRTSERHKTAIRRAATSNQVRALHSIATRRGLNLSERSRDRFQLYRAEGISVSEVIRLIDDLNADRATSRTRSSGSRA